MSSIIFRENIFNLNLSFNLWVCFSSACFNLLTYQQLPKSLGHWIPRKCGFSSFYFFSGFKELSYLEINLEGTVISYFYFLNIKYFHSFCLNTKFSVNSVTDLLKIAFLQLCPTEETCTWQRKMHMLTRTPMIFLFHLFI